MQPHSAAAAERFFLLQDRHAFNAKLPLQLTATSLFLQLHVLVCGTELATLPWTICQVSWTLKGHISESNVCTASGAGVIGVFSLQGIININNSACAGLAIIFSLYLIWMHAIHYTKPYEQRQYSITQRFYAR